MKTFFVLFTILLATTSLAQTKDFTVLDISYLPPEKGQEFEVIYATYTDKLESNILGVKFSSQEAKRQHLALNYNYGISDKAQVGIGYTHSLNYEITDSFGPASSANGTSSTLKYKGGYDPVLSANYRAMEQSSSPMNLDIKLSYSPKLFKAESATATKDGSVARGGDEKALKLQASKKFVDVEVAGFVIKSFFGSATAESQTGGGDSETTARETLEIGGLIQYSLERVILGAGLSTGSVDGFDSGAGASKVKYPSRSSRGITLAGNYLLEDSKGVTLAYKQRTMSEFAATSGATTIDYKNVTSDGFELGYVVAF